jgi:hypothetical protein
MLLRGVREREPLTRRTTVRKKKPATPVGMTEWERRSTEEKHGREERDGGVRP